MRDNHIAEYLFIYCSTQSSDKTRTAALGSIHPLIRKVTGNISPYEKPPDLHTHLLHPSSTEVRNEWNHVSNPYTFYTDTNSPSPSLDTMLPLQTRIFFS